MSTNFGRTCKDSFTPLSPEVIKCYFFYILTFSQLSRLPRFKRQGHSSEDTYSKVGGFLTIRCHGHTCLRQCLGGDGTTVDAPITVGRRLHCPPRNSRTTEDQRGKVPGFPRSQGCCTEPISKDSVSSGEGSRTVGTEFHFPTQEPSAHRWLSSYVCLPISSLEGREEEA